MSVHKEISFEAAIEADLLKAGWQQGFPANYDIELGLDTSELMIFLGATQAELFDKLAGYYGGIGNAQKKVTDRIASEINARGALDVLSQLAGALAGEAAQVIITTLQKFPYVLGELTKTSNSTYAVIVDEAHSSQTGETAKALKQVLAATGTTEIPVDDETAALHAAAAHEAVMEAAAGEADLLTDSALARGKHDNLSFRVHRHPEGQDSGAVRNAGTGVWRRCRGIPAVPHLFDAPGYRGGIHP